MGKITSEKMLDLLYNKKLPQAYRDADSKIKYPLKRYLESLIVGGYYGSIKDIEDTMLLIDPMAVSDEFFPYLCQSFGLPYLPDLDISYQRKFLANIGEIIRRRGTFSCVRYMIRAVTGLNCEMEYFEGEYNGQDGNYLFIVLLADNLEQFLNIETSMFVIENYIGYHIPYYIGPVLSARLSPQRIESKVYHHTVVSSYKIYKIKRYKLEVM